MVLKAKLKLGYPLMKACGGNFEAVCTTAEQEIDWGVWRYHPAGSLSSNLVGSCLFLIVMLWI